MRHKIKSLGIAVIMLFALLAMTACSSAKTAEDDSVPAEIVESLKYSQDGILSSLSYMSDEDIESYIASGDEFTIIAMNAWKDNRDELGAYQGIKETEVVLDGELYLVTSDVAYELADATVTMNVDAQSGAPTYIAMEVQYSLGELMKQAGLNTLMGVGIVFLVLLLLTFLISLFQYLGKIGKKPEKVNASSAAPKAAPAAEPEEELVDDTELVAVIAAAIAASENTSTDSFVVRSIRRKPNNKWQRA